MILIYTFLYKIATINIYAYFFKNIFFSIEAKHVIIIAKTK